METLSTDLQKDDHQDSIVDYDRFVDQNLQIEAPMSCIGNFQVFCN